MNPEDLVGATYQQINSTAIKAHFDAMADGEFMYFIYTNFYCRVQRISWDRGIMRFALCSNAEFVSYQYEVVGGEMNITSVSCVALSAADKEQWRNDLENALEVELVFESNKTTLISSEILGQFEL